MKFWSFLLIGALVFALSSEVRCDDDESTDFDKDAQETSDAVKKDMDELAAAMEEAAKELLRIADEIPSSEEFDKLVENTDKELGDDDSNSSNSE